MVDLKKTTEDVELHALAKSYQRVKHTALLNTLYWIAGYLVSLYYSFHDGIVWSPSSCQPSMIIPIPIALLFPCAMMVMPLRNPLEVAWFFLLRSYTWIIFLPIIPILTGHRIYRQEGGQKSLIQWIHKVKKKIQRSAGYTPTPT